MIWLSPHPRWTTIDYAECLVHEFIHLNLFLGDMLYGLYVDPKKVHESDALVVSAIRKVPRPIDKSLHSACVAVGLAYYYHLLDQPETIENLLRPLKLCVEGLKLKQEKYLSNYGRAIVDSLDQFISNPDFARLSRQMDSLEFEHFSILGARSQISIYDAFKDYDRVSLVLGAGA